MAIPFLGQKPTFGFIVHPRGREDLLAARCLSILREGTSTEGEFISRACNCPPTIVGELLFGFTPYRGELVSIGRLPPEVASPRGRQDILQAARVMLERGARVVGLGALTSPATAGGEWLVEQMPSGLTITNGNAFTAAVLRRNVLEALDALAVERTPRVAIVGAAGSVGSALTRLLADAAMDLVLIGRSTARVRQVLGAAVPGARFSESLGDAVTADVVVVLTSDPSARLTPAHVMRGAVVIDAAEPVNIADEALPAWAPHAFVVRGARVTIPGFHSTFEMGLASGETFSCLAETYLFAREGIVEHSVGAPDPALAERLERAALKHGVLPSRIVPESLSLPAETSREAMVVGAAGADAAMTSEPRSNEYVVVHPRPVVRVL